MTIALVAHDTKKELMVQFCIAYRQILSEHRLIATGTTGRLVAEATGLNVQRFLPGGHGGEPQVVAVHLAKPRQRLQHVRAVLAQAQQQRRDLMPALRQRSRRLEELLPLLIQQQLHQ